MHIKRPLVTPQAEYSKKVSNTVHLEKQIVEYSKPQLLAVWKELNPNGYEPTARKGLQIYFIERLSDNHEHICTPVPFAVNTETPSTASGGQHKDFPPSTSKPVDDLPQRVYSRVVQRSSDGMNRKQGENEKRLVKPERAGKACEKRQEESESGYVQHTRTGRESKGQVRGNRDLGHRVRYCSWDCFSCQLCCRHISILSHQSQHHCILKRWPHVNHRT